MKKSNLTKGDALFDEQGTQLASDESLIVEKTTPTIDQVEEKREQDHTCDEEKSSSTVMMHHDENPRGLVTRIRRRLKKSTQLISRDRPMFATVCVNNCNRSMAAHQELESHGLRVCSFGAGPQVTFPGRTAASPRIFRFMESYESMYKQLQAEDTELFTKNGVLKLLRRNMAIKHAPQRWQALSNKQLNELDVVVVLDYRMFLVVLNDLRMRLRFCFQKKQLHIICLEVEDTPDDAVNGSILTLTLCQELEQDELNEDTVKQVVVRFEQEHNLEMFYVGLRV